MEVPPPIVVAADPPVPTKRRKTSDGAAATKVKAAKKPQMKYDPDVPMTKEEAAVWRREQRRKRNRESAAASRQRQRDRIAELEVEVDEWKVKYEAILDKIRKLEEGGAPSASSEPPHSGASRVHTSQIVSPPASPPRQTPVEVLASPVSSSVVSLEKQVTPDDRSVVKVEQEQKPGHTDKMISRQAAS